MLFAAAFCVAPDVAAVSAAARTTTSESATMLRFFIWMLPESGGSVAAIGTDHSSLRRMLSQRSPRCQYQSCDWSLPEGRGRGDRHGRGAADADLGHDPVAVAPVGRARELDHVACRRAGDALEEERRRVKRNAERARLLFVRHRRLDRLRAPNDRDP